jgi:hypothetical protein
MAFIGAVGSEDYKASINALLKTIETNEVGKVVVRGVKSSYWLGKLIIQPRVGDAYHGYCDVVTSPTSPSDAYPHGVRPGPKPKSDAALDRRAFTGANAGDPDEQEPEGFVGTGVGSNSVIEFSPDTFGAGEKTCYHGQYGSLPDEVLFHEMVHGLRNMQGLRNPWPTEDRGYRNEEEFLAIVATNVYISSKGSTQLRRDGDGHSPLEAPLDTSAGFLSDLRNLKILKIHQLIWSPTFADLAHVVTAKFNPFRELWMRTSHSTAVVNDQM